MSDKSKIEWTDATWNPIRGCTRVSPGCGGPGKVGGCYAERHAARFSGAGLPFEGFAERKNGEARWTGKLALIDELLTVPLRWKTPRRIFVNSMSDLFHEKLSDEAIDKVFAMMALCPQHTFQILTKRAERMRDYMLGLSSRHTPDGNMQLSPRVALADVAVRKLPRGLDHNLFESLLVGPWPLPNAWLGVSTERQQEADERIPLLLQTPAAVRFISAEPLLGPIDLTAIQRTKADGFMRPLDGRFNKLDWIIAGGESGPLARPMHPQWARDLRDQCAAAGVPFFFKQFGEWSPNPKFGRVSCCVLDDGTVLKAGKLFDRPFDNTGEFMWRLGKKDAGRLLDGREHNEFPAPRAQQSEAA